MVSGGQSVQDTVYGHLKVLYIVSMSSLVRYHLLVEADTIEEQDAEVEEAAEGQETEEGKAEDQGVEQDADEGKACEDSTELSHIDVFTWHRPLTPPAFSVHFC